MTTPNDGGRGSEAVARAAAAPTISPGQCPTPDVLRAEAEGVLPDDLSARVITHRAACGLCARLQSALTGLKIEGPSEAEQRRIRARIGVAPTGPNN